MTKKIEAPIAGTDITAYAKYLLSIMNELKEKHNLKRTVEVKIGTPFEHFAWDCVRVLEELYDKFDDDINNRHQKPKLFDFTTVKSMEPTIRLLEEALTFEQKEEE